jgi:type IV secretion system protein VirB4
VAAAQRLNNALRRLGSSWALFVEASRQTAQRYPDSKFPDRVSALVDTERRAQFEEEGVHFETAYYLTFLFLPPVEQARPEIPMYLDAILVDEPLTGGLEPRLGNAHLRTLTVFGFPTSTHPGILDDLNRLAFPYRWCTRAICLDKTDATRVVTRIRQQWFAKRKSVGAILKEVMTNEASVLVDSDASNKALDADAALQELWFRRRRARLRHRHSHGLG